MLTALFPPNCIKMFLTQVKPFPLCFQYFFIKVQDILGFQNIHEYPFIYDQLSLRLHSSSFLHHPYLLFLPLQSMFFISMTLSHLILNQNNISLWVPNYQYSFNPFLFTHPLILSTFFFILVLLLISFIHAPLTMSRIYIMLIFLYLYIVSFLLFIHYYPCSSTHISYP